MIAVVDYGVGNLFSLRSSLKAVGGSPVVTGDPQTILKADKLILPGVGAFGDAAEKLRAAGLADVICEAAQKGTPLLGICLGMQLLFERSYEYGMHSGLGLIPGTVNPICTQIPKELKIPHMGWNALHFPEHKSRIFEGVSQGEYVYFVHSYAAQTDKAYVSATTDYGACLTAAAERDNIFGCQFHPEKSGPAGLRILENFCRL